MQLGPEASSSEAPAVAPHVGRLGGVIDGSHVLVSASFGDAERACDAPRSIGACVVRTCKDEPPARFASVPHAGDVEVRTPDGVVGHLRSGADGVYGYEPGFPSFRADAPSFSFTGEGASVPPFHVEVATANALGAVTLPGAGPQSALHDLEIPHEPYEAAFELRIEGPTRDGHARAVVDCAFTGGAAFVPRAVLDELALESEIHGFAAGITRSHVRAGDFEIDAQVLRDSKSLTFTLR